VRLTHRGILHCGTVTGSAFQITAGDVALALLPLYHTATHFIPLPVLMAGGTVVVHEGFKAETAFALLEDARVTLFPTVSAVATLMAKHAESSGRLGGLEDLRMVFFGGAGVPDALLSAWARFAPNTAIANVYGLTEMGPAVAAHDPNRHPPKPGSVGPPYRGIEVRIEGDPAPNTIGEILVRAPSMTAGYWRNEQATQEALRDGWLHTGDLGFLDEDGFLYISGRRKHMLKRGGENVFPNEVEAAIIRHPAVKEVIVVGVPDEVMGERVAALLAPQPGVDLDAEDVVAYAAQRLADFKVPELVAVLAPELPKNSVGKVDLRGLQARARTDGFEFLEFRRGRPVRR
jgi:acyl-CoA synthetase (AMP-forming)/AMP-acid ligase II